MKKTICITVVIALLYTSNFSVYSEKTSKIYKVLHLNNGSYSYIYRGNDIQIMDYSGTDSKVIVPSEIEGRKVVKFGYDPEKDKKYYDYNDEYDVSSSGWGIRDNQYIREISLPDTITDIENFSFVNCKNLRKASLGNGVKYLYNTTFYECNNLEQLILSESLVEFDCDTLGNTKVKNIKLGKDLKSFIGAGYDLRLQSLNVNKHNKWFSSKNGVLYNKKKTRIVYYPRCKKNKSFKIFNKITTIDKYTMSNKLNLKYVTLPKRLKRIGVQAFYDDKKLSKVVFKGKQKIQIAKEAFIGCAKLKNITIPKSVKKIGEKAFGYKLYGDKIKGFTIKGYKGTAAEKYAKKNKFKFVALD